MKSGLTKLFKAFMYRHILRLTIVCFCLICANVAIVAGPGSGTTNYYANVTVTVSEIDYEAGAGLVYVKHGTKRDPESGGSKTATTGEISGESLSVTLGAIPHKHYYLSAWKQGSTTTSVSGNEHSVTLKDGISTDANQYTSVVYTPVFLKRIIPANTALSINLDLTKVAQTNIAVKGKNLDFTPKSTDKFNVTLSEPVNGNCVLTVTATENAIGGDNIVVIISDENATTANVTVTCVEQQKVTLMGSQYGSYSVSVMGATPFIVESSDNIEIPIDNPENFTLTFSEIAPNDGYRLSHFNVTPENVGVLSYGIYDDDNNGTETTPVIKDNAVIEPVFIPSNYAQFIILDGDTSVHYNDLNRAISKAVEQKKKVVAVSLAGGQTGVLPTGNYVISDGITFLVPGDSKYTYSKSDVTIADFGDYTNRSNIKCIKKLEVADNTTITVQDASAISVYAKMSYVQAWNGTPFSYGQINLGNNSHVVVKSGCVLSALGYITGTYTLKNETDYDYTSSVSIESGATIYEAFQLADWRGGGATISIVGVDIAGAIFGDIVANGNSYDVFPIGQYYVQSVETKLLIESGATEKVVTAVDMSLGTFAANAPFIVPSSSSGFFRLGAGTKLIKYYDKQSDRLKFRLEGNGKSDVVEVDRIDMVFPDAVGSKDIELSSSKFILPINNNIDVTIKNVTAKAVNKIAFLAGSSLFVDDDAEFIVLADQYVYDKDQNSLKDGSGNTVGYFSALNTQLNVIPYTPGNTECINNTYTTATDKKRTPTNLLDASWIVNGKVTINSNGSVYTTEGGADITSGGNGRFYYGGIGTKSNTYQVLQKESSVDSWPSFPVTNAKLHNNESLNPTEHYSAGNNANKGDTYVYFKDQGKWLIPKLGITTWSGNNFNVTLPNPLEQDVVCPVVAEGVTIKTWSYDVQGTGFLKNGECSYSNETLTIPVKYTPSNIHNVETPYEGELSITITYDDPLEGSDLTKIIRIPLVAKEDYTPNFSVIINGNPVDDGGEYVMTGFVDKQTIAPVVVLPETSNVATLPSTDWDKDVANPFAFEYGSVNKLADAELTYTPSSKTSHTGQLELMASYTDAASNTLTKTVTIHLNATADKSPSSLALNKESDVIYQGMSIQDVFRSLGNNQELSFTYNGASSYEDDLIKVVKNANDNYDIVTKEVDHITDARTITITATQAEDNATYTGTATCEIVVLPAAIWNWSDLYYGSTNFNPIVPQKDEPWTLELIDNPCEVVQLTYDNTDGYKSIISTPHDPAETCTAKFRFTQGGYIKEFTSNIYADPRVLSYCVDQVRTYRGVTLVANSVTFDDNEDQVKFSSTANQTSSWTIQLIGVPSELRFTPLVSDNAWRIEEYNGIFWTTTYNLDNIPANSLFTHTLQPSTQQIRITYAAGIASTGLLQNVCVSALTGVEANTKKVYMPVAKEASGVVVPTTQKVVIYSVVNEMLSLSLSTGEMMLDVESIPANASTYTRQEVTITNNGSNTSTTQYLYVKKGEETLLTLPIQPFEFRQGLPINTESDNAERYYYLTTAVVK